MSPLRTVFLCSAVLLAAAPAAATALCDKDDPRVELQSPSAEVELETLPVVEEILPCAMVESGQLGAFCPEATVYVVTQNGTKLCRVFLPDVDLTASKSCDLNKRAPSPSPERVQNHSPSVAEGNLPPLPAAPFARDGDQALAVALATPLPVFAEPPFVPG
jgi:hypothetical protein